jgi:hypothetical protein
VAFGDIGLMVVRLTRPLPGPFPREVDDRLAHRHLDLLIDGLRAAHDGNSALLDGPGLTLADLRAMAPTAETAEAAAASDPTHATPAPPTGE